MSLLANLDIREEDLQEEFNVDQGESNFIRETGNFELVIKKPYLRQAKESKSVALVLEMENREGKKLIENIWFLNKQGSPYTEVNGKQVLSRNFNLMRAVLGLATGSTDIPKTEERQLTDHEGKAFTAEVMPTLINKTIGVCIQRVIEPHWENPDETVTRYQVKNYYDPVSNKTWSEKSGNKEPKIVKEWSEKVLKGEDTYDKTKSSGGSNAQSNGSVQRPKF